jgi:hypothetical protein
MCPGLFTMFEWLLFIANVLSEGPEVGSGEQQEPLVVSQVLSLGSILQTPNSGQGVSVFTLTWSAKLRICGHDPPVLADDWQHLIALPVPVRN